MSVEYTHINKPSCYQLTDFTKFKEDVKNTLIVIVDTYTSWCGPCKHVGPLFEELAAKYKENDNVIFYKEDVDVDDPFHKPSAVPSFYFYHKGKKEHTEHGGDIDPVEKYLVELLQQNLK